MYYSHCRFSSLILLCASIQASPRISAAAGNPSKLKLKFGTRATVQPHNPVLSYFLDCFISARPPAPNASYGRTSLQPVLSAGEWIPIVCCVNSYLTTPTCVPSTVSQSRCSAPIAIVLHSRYAILGRRILFLPLVVILMNSYHRPILQSHCQVA